MTQSPPENQGLPEGRITEEAMDRLRALVGVHLRTERFLRAVTSESMGLFAKGIGDLNPLFCDEEYAKWTRWGGIIGHPCLPYARHYPGRTRFGLPGVHGFFGGNDWTWHRTVKPGDTLACTEQVTGVEEKESRLSGRLVLTRTVTCYYNQRDELVAEAEGWSTRHERRASREGAKKPKDDSGRGRHDYTEDDLDLIEATARREWQDLTAGRTLYVDDVAPGTEIPAIVRGPLTAMDITAYLMGVGRSRGAHGVMLREADKHPAHFFRNRAAGGGLEYTGAGHVQASVAKQVGAPGSYDYGPQRISWLASLLTNWIGDLGRLVRLRAELRGFNVIGDTTWIKGRVAGTRVENGQHLVDCEVWGENQLGTTTMPGLATVALPSRSLLEPRAASSGSGHGG